MIQAAGMCKSVQKGSFVGPPIHEQHADDLQPQVCKSGSFSSPNSETLQLNNLNCNQFPGLSAD